MEGFFLLMRFGPAKIWELAALAPALKPGAFCSMPPGVRHEVSNPSKTDEALFLIVHASHDGYDYVPVPFRETEAALPFSPRS